jgi:hypothetical protein
MAAWYFWNSETDEVTWTNPLQSEAPPLPDEVPPANSPPDETDSKSKSKQKEKEQSHQVVRGPHGIDPDLAYLLPSHAKILDEHSQGAMMAARTGRFALNDFTRTADHQSDRY